MDEPVGLVAESLREGQIVAEPLSFDAFFEAEARTLFRRLCAVTGNSAEAEEIMQDAFLALWERWDRIGAIQDPTAYLYRTAMNVFRRRSRRAALAVRRALSPRPIRHRSPRSTSSRTSWPHSPSSRQGSERPSS
jgi:DNA-directed RNA polymerase specialized sigma24 family protein